MIKYEYCCEVGDFDDLFRVQKRAADGWRVISVDGRSGGTCFYMERETTVAPLVVSAAELKAGSAAKRAAALDMVAAITGRQRRLIETALFSIKPGDVVRLKGGGPRMTVETVGSEKCNCAWFDDDQNLHREVYELGSLVHV